MFAHCLEQPTRTASLTSLPRRYRFRERTRVAGPIRSCSRWGLPCRRRCRKRGALFPHLFTLAASPFRAGKRFVLCGTFPGVAPAGRYPAPYVDGARTFLSCGLSTIAGAAVRPTDAPRHGGSGAPRQGISLVNCTGGRDGSNRPQGERRCAMTRPEQLGEALLASSSDAIVATDREGRITFWNPGAARIFGFTQ